jgi:hypothetical protein
LTRRHRSRLWYLSVTALALFAVLCVVSFIGTEQKETGGWHNAFLVVTLTNSPWPTGQSVKQSSWAVVLAICGFLIIPAIAALVVTVWYGTVDRQQQAVANQQQEVARQQDELAAQQRHFHDQVNLAVRLMQGTVAPVELSAEMAEARRRLDAGEARTKASSTPTQPLAGGETPP